MSCPGLHCPGPHGASGALPLVIAGFGGWYAIEHGHGVTTAVNDLLVTVLISVGTLVVLMTIGLVLAIRREFARPQVTSKPPPAIRADAEIISITSAREPGADRAAIEPAGYGQPAARPASRRPRCAAERRPR